jgi:heme-degrading monooxygenase HmoA
MHLIDNHASPNVFGCRRLRRYLSSEDGLMIVTVFRSRLNPAVQEEYAPMAKRMSELASNVPGYISHKGFVAEDGERVTIVEFESEQALQQWRVDPEHAKAKRRGVEHFFSEFSYQICSVVRQRNWIAKAQPKASA